ncbi:tetratricopeptide TPR_1 repeat-containing protein [Nostoc linckia z18]|uniref:Tetratricopeptide TPR_1 repeat-containing protein n=2 Tax=Nostoc linckia TaxID=92942 RepID=A0A9Q5ZCK0_NOSLI|nr:CHAT domain-containing tetratricopeptide repeat protein [Nostoc linckia]PHK40217.1 tetratricopeptide TPR_1 repeat-containing protein [Nostoc linckia z15]PHK45325.1 tetratricopeptide TPR_1 repeat-containing protein [Nostoc linckia z16]PHJ60815.1 tetratricopeptide TPR_1 repeat-containing protein [Nostoc linckia z1]PHJ68119.1 tetratricopeptide TPR_1 repeat-containing protein [Nostoc linckia z2]PHJ71744.1 tetratricopeptide TPR_1 repeat-containing protein [Nostoc linckia z3]
MKRSAKSQRVCWWFLPKLTRYSLTLLLSAVMLGDAVGATPRKRGLQIAQQPGTTQQDATRAAAERVSQEGMQLYQQGTAESLRQAIGKWQEALKLWQQVDDKRWEAITLLRIARVYNDLGEKQQALKYYNQALPIFRAVGDRRGEATTLNDISNLYSSLGEKQEALKYYNQALPISRAVGDRRIEATTLVGIGLVYSSLGEKQEALKYYNQALPISRAVGDRRIEAATLASIGAVYSDLGEKQQALLYYNQALPISRAVGDRRIEAATLVGIGAVYSDLGEKQQALLYYNQALPISRAVGDRRIEAAALNNIGQVYYSLGEKQQALSYYNQTLPIRRAVGDRTGEATTLVSIGQVYYSLGEKQQALSYYNQALPISRAVGDRTGEATTLVSIGQVYYSLGEKQQALSYLNQALPILRAVGDRGGEARTLNNIGLVYSSLGEKQQALSYYNQVLPICRAVGDKEGEATTLTNMAFLERSQGNLQQAQTHIQAAIEIIEDLRTKIADKELRASYFASVQGYYKFYTDLLMELHKKDPSKGYDALALQVSDRSRARGLIELLTEANIDIKKGIDPKLLAEETSLQWQINAQEKLLSELASKKETPEQVLTNTKQKIQDLLKQQRELEVKIRANNPEYADLIYPQPLTLKQIQQQLDKDTLLLQYSLGEERSYLWAVTPDSLHSYELPKRQEIDKAAKNLYDNYLKNPGYQGVSPEETAKAANELSQLILKPVADKLGQKRLVIVGDEALQYIPFAALTTSTKSADGSDYQPLVVNHEIISLPSASTIAILRKQTIGRTKAPKTLAILADPVFSANDERVTGKSSNVANNNIDQQLQESALKRSTRNIKRSEIQRLPGTEKEAQEILKLVSPSENIQAFGFDANYNWATNDQLSQYKILHFATHGFLDSTEPELSGIVLSLIDKQGKSQRGFLRLTDIFNLNFPAELVVLSACQTGLGEEVKGEGLVGLTRGLMYAGAARVVVSLWNVDDEATSLLMSQFYSQMLQQGKTPAAALRAAQLKMWSQEQWRNPYSWSAFTLLGEWR